MMIENMSAHASKASLAGQLSDPDPELSYTKVRLSRVSTGEAAKPSSLASMKHNNRKLMMPWYLNFKHSDTEIEYAQYFAKHNRKRWKLGFLILNAWMALAYLYVVVNDVMTVGPYNGVMAGIDVGMWIVSAVLPLLALGYCAKMHATTIFLENYNLMHSVAIGICIIGISVRYFVADVLLYFGTRFAESLYFVNFLTILSCYLFRVRFSYSIVTCGIVFWVQLALSIAKVVSVPLALPPLTYYIGLGTFITAISCIFGCHLAYMTESNYRMEFLLASDMKKNSAKLANQLKLLSMAHTTKHTGALDSPLERTVVIIRSIMADPSLPTQHLMSLGQSISLLNSPNLLAPDLEGNLDDVDNEQQAWIFSEIATKKRKSNKIVRKVSVAPDGTGIEEVGIESMYVHLGDYPSLDRKTSMISKEEPETSYPPILDPIIVLMTRIGDFNFPLFDFSEATKRHSLVVAGQHFFMEANLYQTFGIQPEKFTRFLRSIEDGYHSDLPYHNAIHATDVLHCVAWLSKQSVVREVLSDIEILSLYLSAIIHDHDHPGVTNNFLVNTLDAKAVLYNDKSVLENHHLATSFEKLSHFDKNFLEHLPKADFKAIRENVIELVLATDLTQHFSLLSMFKAKTSGVEHYDPSNTREERMLVYKIMIKCGDVSNPTKELGQYEKWCSLLLGEFLSQGDMEKSKGIPVSPYMDRDNLNVPSMQTGFIDYVVFPLYEAFDKFQPIPTVLNRLQRNREHWSDLKQRGITTLTDPTMMPEQNSNLSQSGRVDFLRGVSASTPSIAISLHPDASPTASGAQSRVVSSHEITIPPTAEELDLVTEKEEKKEHA